MQISEISDVSYHRNGVSGVGFTVVRFKFEENADTYSAVAVLFNDQSGSGLCNGECAVLIEGEDGRIDIHSKWRGDHFEEELREYIDSEDGKKKMFPTIYKEAVE